MDFQIKDFNELNEKEIEAAVEFSVQLDDQDNFTFSLYDPEDFSPEKTLYFFPLDSHIPFAVMSYEFHDSFPVLVNKVQTSLNNSLEIKHFIFEKFLSKEDKEYVVRTMLGYDFNEFSLLKSIAYENIVVVPRLSKLNFFKSMGIKKGINLQEEPIFYIEK